MPADAIGRSVEGECDRIVAAAAPASRATVTNPVIVRCFVMGTSGLFDQRTVSDACFRTSSWVGRNGFVRARELFRRLGTNETTSRDRDWRVLGGGRHHRGNERAVRAH